MALRGLNTLGSRMHTTIEGWQCGNSAVYVFEMILLPCIFVIGGILQNLTHGISFFFKTQWFVPWFEMIKMFSNFRKYARFFTIWFLLLSLHLSFVKALCYYPNGMVSDDIPCDPSGANSTCCQMGWTCLSNNVCKNEMNPADISYGRHSCTDKSWSSAACPHMCEKCTASH